jgi:hypothetical protein
MGRDKVKLGSFIREAIERLEKDCTYDDLMEIKLKVNEVWRKHHPLEDVAVVD